MAILKGKKNDVWFQVTAVGPQGEIGPAGADGFSPTAKVTQTETGATITITDKDGTTEATIESGSGGMGYPYKTPQDYGALGNGITDDTIAFQNALNNNRVVFVPGGIYKLSGELIISDNCELQLSQDTVLNFSQTSGNCITLMASASIKGHHATIIVPYTFDGNVINVTNMEYSQNDIDGITPKTPPFEKWDPQWKTGRYITDVNITKPDSRGFHYSIGADENGDYTSGNAVYIEADGNTDLHFIWGLNFSGLRIAGAFKCGIKAQNTGSYWNHEMRVEAVIDACETGVALTNCNCAYISAAVQPRRALTKNGELIPYAKWGVYLNNSRDIDLTGTRIWDWNATNTLWQGPTNQNGNNNKNAEYQHIAMYGVCPGIILNDFLYYRDSNDIRDLIYSDNKTNLERLVILQEPFTRWFKPVNESGIAGPFFNDGTSTNKRLAFSSELEELSNLLGDVVDDATLRPEFDDVLDEGARYSIGYKGLNPSGQEITLSKEYFLTDYIPITQKESYWLYLRDVIPDRSDDNYTNISWYDSEKNWLSTIKFSSLWASSYWELALSKNKENKFDGFSMFFAAQKSASSGIYASYFRISVCKSTTDIIDIDGTQTTIGTGVIGNNIFMRLIPVQLDSSNNWAPIKPTLEDGTEITTIEQAMSFTTGGALSEKIIVKPASIPVLSNYEKVSNRVTTISSVSTNDVYPTAKAVYDYVQSAIAAALSTQ